MLTEPAVSHTTRAVLARYYDLDLAPGEPDVETYVAMAAGTTGAILELACGSGRVAVPLAAAGHDAVGVDNDAAMLDRARQAWSAHESTVAGRGSLRLVEADITDLALPDRFGLAILSLNTLLMLPGRAAQQRALDAMAAHLDRGGRAVVDVWLPTPADLALYDGRLLLDWVRRDPETDEWVSKTTSATYFPAARTAQITTFFEAWRDGSPAIRTHRTDTVTFVALSELTRMLEQAGLEPEIVAGDYDMSEMEPHSERAIVVCRAKRRSRSGPSVGRSGRSEVR